MASSMIYRLISSFQTFDHALKLILNRGLPPEALCTISYSGDLNQPYSINKPSGLSLKDIIGDGLLWAVPKHRRSIEKRLSRRFGIPGLNYKPPVPKTNILMCPKCGHHYEAGHLCGKCYEKVKLETKEMQDAIQENLGLSPVEQDVIVIYEGEKESRSDEFWKKQRVVEMPKKRPEWFHENLLQPSTAEPSDSKDVKPTELA